MDLLLDTSTFLWAIGDPDRLTARGRSALEDPANRLVLSVASIWEIVLKAAKGKLLDGLSVEQRAAFLDQHIRLLGTQLLPIHRSHVLAVAPLPPIHHDPFDRLLIAQAKVEGLTFMTVDAAMQSYGLVCFW